MGQGRVSAPVGCGLVRARRGARGSRACAAGVALSWRLTGLEASAGAGSLVGSAGEESVFSTTGTSATGAAAVSVSAELRAMASGVGSGAVRSDSGLSGKKLVKSSALRAKTRAPCARGGRPRRRGRRARAARARRLHRYEILAHSFGMGEISIEHSLYTVARHTHSVLELSCWLWRSIHCTTGTYHRLTTTSHRRCPRAPSRSS